MSDARWFYRGLWLGGSHRLDRDLALAIPDLPAGHRAVQWKARLRQCANYLIGLPDERSVANTLACVLVGLSWHYPPSHPWLEQPRRSIRHS